MVLIFEGPSIAVWLEREKKMFGMVFNSATRQTRKKPSAN